MGLLELIQEDNLQVKKLASTHGGEYHGPCPLCGGVDRFHVWPQEGEDGKWWCRGCNKGGDSIQYLRDVRHMTFPQACAAMGKDPGQFKRTLDWEAPAKSETRNRKWTPRKITPPPEEWQTKCLSFVNWCHAALLKEPKIIAFLENNRGIKPETIQTFHLGWNPQNLRRERKLWGLSEEEGKGGKPKEIWLPQGIVIPSFAGEKIHRARIRRINIEGKTPASGPSYCIVSGSSSEAMILGANRGVLVVVESEFDGILLHQEIGDLAGVIALGSAHARPDQQTAAILKAANLILVALDNDEHREDGQNPGAKEAWGWWMNHFDQARRLPPVEGKDPGEMWKAGINLKDWVSVGIELFQIPSLSPPERGPIPKIEPPPNVNVNNVNMEELIDKIYMGKLQILIRSYPNGLYDWLLKNHPDIDQTIENDEATLNSIWTACLNGRATVQDFKDALSIWFDQMFDAIILFRKEMPDAIF